MLALPAGRMKELSVRVFFSTFVENFSTSAASQGADSRARNGTDAIESSHGRDDAMAAVNRWYR